MVVRDTCPGCGSNRGKKNGPTRHGQQHPWKTCGRPLTAPPLDRSMAPEQRLRIAHLLGERLSRRGICRTLGVRLTWLFHCMVERFTACPEHLQAQCATQPTAVVRSRLEAEADERESGVQKQANKHGIWSALEATTRHSIALHGGERSRDGGKARWATMPTLSRAQAQCSTAPYAVYQGGMPAGPHRAITKHARKTHHLARCKKQQMQWSKHGAHLLLQTRVKTLNGELGTVLK